MKKNNPIFESNLTSQQLFNQITEKCMIQSLSKVKKHQVGCSMHPKPSNKCRQCKLKSQNMSSKIQTVDQNTFQLNQQFPTIIRLNTQNPIKHLNEKLQANITSNHIWKQEIKSISNVKQLLLSLSHDPVYFEAYLRGTTDQPTLFITVLYRLIQLRPTKQQLIIMLRNNNVNVRGLGLLYIRLCLSFEDMYACIKDNFKEKKILKDQTTIGQYALRLLDPQLMDHYGVRLPRIPGKIQHAINNKLKQFKELKELKQAEKNANEQNQQFKIVSEQNNVQSALIKNQNRQNKQKRSRSRQKNHKKEVRNKRLQQSSNSQQQSSSSQPQSSSSSLSSQQKKDLKDLKEIKIKKEQQNKNVGLQEIRNRIKKMQQKTLKKQQILQKYISKNNNQQEEQYQDSQSSSVQKYKIG